MLIMHSYQPKESHSFSIPIVPKMSALSKNQKGNPNSEARQAFSKSF